MARVKEYMLIRCLGHKSVKLRPGDTYRIGRHHSNDLVLNDGTVSRFHAVIEWDDDDSRPWITDNDSSNGVEVDGVEIDGRHFLPGDNQIGIGDFTVILQLKGKKKIDATRKVSPVTDHLIDDGPSVVRLFSESTRRIRGSFRAPEDLHRVLLDLEAAERTGTLKIKESGGMTRVILGQGRVITVSRDGQRVGEGGMEAFVEVMRLPNGAYEFSADLEPSEENLALSIKEYLEKDSDSTMRFDKGPLEDGD